MHLSPGDISTVDSKDLNEIHPISEKKKISVNIRPYKPSDKEKVNTINEVSLEISFHYYFDIFHRQDPGLFLVAEHANEIVGFVLAKNGENFGESPTAIIFAIAVIPQYRSLGIGEQLINALSQELKRKNIKKLFLHVRVGNTRGIKFYQQLDFNEIITVPEFYSWGEDAYRMVKIIK